MPKKSKKYLHFRMGDGFTDIVRQMFWYEDKFKAYRILDSMIGITMTQKDAILNGDAFLEPIKEGTQMRLVYKEDKVFKAEIAAHKLFLLDKAKLEKAELEARLEAARKEAEYAEISATGRLAEELSLPTEKHHAYRKAKKNGGKCKEECQFNPHGTCIFGMRDKWGCWVETEGIESKMNELVALRSTRERAGVMPGSEEERIFNGATVDKIFNFIFEGHEYVLSDSARNQGECPHCGEQAPDGKFWQTKDKGYIGYKKLADEQFAYCFECPSCHEKFFYHHTEEP
jgi:hypothetical protein